MSKLASVIVVALLGSLAVTGCHSKRAKYAGAGLTVATGVASILAAPAARECGSAPSPEMDPLGLQTIGTTFCELDQNMRAGLIFGGVAMILTGLVIAARIDVAAGPETPEPKMVERIPGAETIRAPQTSDAVLRQLSAQAAMAARAGHCTAVQLLADKIAARDLAFRTTVFVEDRAIAACLR